MTPITSNRSFLYCHKENYYRYCRGPRYAFETSYYKKFENEELQDNEQGVTNQQAKMINST